MRVHVRLYKKHDDDLLQICRALGSRRFSSVIIACIDAWANNESYYPDIKIYPADLSPLQNNIFNRVSEITCTITGKAETLIRNIKYINTSSAVKSILRHYLFPVFSEIILDNPITYTVTASKDQFQQKSEPKEKETPSSYTVPDVVKKPDVPVQKPVVIKEPAVKEETVMTEDDFDADDLAGLFGGITHN